MVLQDKYARAASRKYKRTHAPTPEEAAEHAAVDAAIKQVEQRRLGTNADRYQDDDEQRAREEGRSTTVGPDGQPVPPIDEEVDEEEGAPILRPLLGWTGNSLTDRRETELRKAAEQAELEAFLEQQRERLASTSGAADFRAPGEEEEDDEDVDHSFAHLRIGGAFHAGRSHPPPPARPPATAEEKEEMRRMQDDARHRQAVRGELSRRCSTPESIALDIRLYAR